MADAIPNDTGHSRAIKSIMAASLISTWYVIGFQFFDG